MIQAIKQIQCQAVQILKHLSVKPNSTRDFAAQARIGSAKAFIKMFRESHIFRGRHDASKRRPRGGGFKNLPVIKPRAIVVSTLAHYRREGGFVS